MQPALQGRKAGICYSRRLFLPDCRSSGGGGGGIQRAHAGLELAERCPLRLQRAEQQLQHGLRKGARGRAV